MTMRILVLGCGDVVLADVEAPAHPRRGMAVADTRLTCFDLSSIMETPAGAAAFPIRW